MEHTIERAKSCEVGCSNVERKLRQLLDITEDETYFHTRQSAFLYHLGVQTMPKTHHCLNMRLTVEYSYLEATVHVTNIEDNQKLSKDIHSLEMQQLWPAEEFRVTIRNHSEPSQRQMKTEYISIFGHSHFLLPDLLPSLNRVVVLDDDLIVQKDLSSLWNLDMGGKVVGAAQFCEVRLGQLKPYKADHNVNANSCVWLSGLNVIELDKWRDTGITSLYD